jgi:hypothetical protein
MMIPFHSTLPLGNHLHQTTSANTRHKPFDTHQRFISATLTSSPIETHPSSKARPSSIRHFTRTISHDTKSHHFFLNSQYSFSFSTYPPFFQEGEFYPENYLAKTIDACID